MKNEIQSYIINDGVDKYLLEIGGNIASVDYLSSRTECWEPLDVSPELMQSIIDSAGLNFTVGERLGWREMGSQYSHEGYFAINPL